jgi:hypothetical protein
MRNVPAVHERRLWPLEAAARSLKAQQFDRAEARTTVSTLFPGEPATGTARMPSTGRAPAAVGAAAFPRKEVIQPQLPLRLPCYDFTPITDATFGRCLPKGLAHGLRVFPAFVV